ncbi:MAG: LysR family transcriptional regulator [Bradyrhizobium sp.]|nr:LysR family transcriptional regulator [Bradyrhizobium sp.]
MSKPHSSKPRSSKPRSSKPHFFKPHLPLNALRAFEASARHLSFTKAGMELRVSQAAVSHQTKRLEERLGVTLFRRLPRGLALTDEGQALFPAIAESFDRMRMTLERFEPGHFRGVVSVGVVGTFATGWLLSRLPDFAALHPFVDVRIQTNNNRVDLAGEGLDFAVRYGDGLWRSTDAVYLLAAPLSAVCAPQIAKRLNRPHDLAEETLLRSYRADEWPRWFTSAGIACPSIKGAMFDSSITMAEAAAQGAGVALLPVAMFTRELAAGRLVLPFDVTVAMGDYWLTSLKSKVETDAMHAFRRWIVAAVDTKPTLEAAKGRPTSVQLGS